MTAGRELQNLTNTQLKIVMNMRTSRSLVLQAYLFQACCMASSGLEAFLFIDHFYCLRTVFFSVRQVIVGAKVVHFQPAAFPSFAKVCLDALGACSTIDCTQMLKRGQMTDLSTSFLVDIDSTQSI